ncbi:MAG TPA: hypothetical protein K8V56_21025 [Sporosarcina psychrophila]|uniref:Uncharacterized protein n=1 Tax=Sporosarcina psychrophila TaxID=1476 RepID=A0A921G324_SPOPS|nr:hypothetical protein [Sporosarcina psychrophila]
MGTAVGHTVKAAGHTICNIVENGTNVVGGLVNEDGERLKPGTKGLVKVGVIGALSFEVIDMIDGVDGIDANHSASVALPTAAGDVALVDNLNCHHVEPHWRTAADGTQIWVDGDDDTSVHTNEGWSQSNPYLRRKG